MTFCPSNSRACFLMNLLIHPFKFDWLINMIVYQVDNGVIEHLLPSLHQNDWDVLIAHFLGVVSYYVLNLALPAIFLILFSWSWKLARSTLFRTMQGIYLVLTQPR